MFRQPMRRMRRPAFLFCMRCDANHDDMHSFFAFNPCNVIIYQVPFSSMPAYVFDSLSTDNRGKASIGTFPIGFMCSMIASFEQITTIRHVHITAIGFIILIGFIVISLIIRLTNSISVNCRFMEWCFINDEI